MNRKVILSSLILLICAIYSPNGWAQHPRLNPDPPLLYEDNGTGGLIGKELDAAMERYISWLVQSKARVYDCQDEFNGLQYHCKDLPDDWGEEPQTITVYVPPYPATLPRLGLRTRLNETENPVPNGYVALVPQRFIRHGKSALALWQKLADEGRPFGCKGNVCDRLIRLRVTL